MFYKKVLVICSVIISFEKVKFPETLTINAARLLGGRMGIYWWINYKHVRDSFYDDNRQQFLINTYDKGSQMTSTDRFIGMLTTCLWLHLSLIELI